MRLIAHILPNKQEGEAPLCAEVSLSGREERHHSAQRFPSQKEKGTLRYTLG